MEKGKEYNAYTVEEDAHLGWQNKLRNNVNHFIIKANDSQVSTTKSHLILL